MASFIYLYSKFTEEFLLLTSAGIFTLLAVYCYHWVVKKRRLGAARNQVPAGMVKVYLNQLINEAQFVRTQLFGLVNGEMTAGPNTSFQAQHLTAGSPPPAAAEHAPAHSENAGNAIPSDLLERLKALESQLTEKESMVININVEKTKLLEEIENLKQNQKATQGAAPVAANNDALLAKMKGLEERLEEYALFEDDLANLKRLQQENASLKKRLESSESSTTVKGNLAPASEPEVTLIPAQKEPKLEAVPKPEPQVEVAAAEESSPLDRAAIDALLEGSSPVPPSAAPEPVIDMSANSPEPDFAKKTLEPEAKAASSGDDFEKLIDSVETSLTKEAPAPAPAAQVATAAPEQAAKAEAKPEDHSNKTDEELLKEFESLLNS